MNAADMDKLWAMLAAYRQNDPKLQDRAKKRAYALSLEPYAFEDVRDAVAVWFRKNKTFPEPSEIAAMCPPADEPPRAAGRQRGDEKVEELRKRWFELRAKRREQGLSETVADAKGMGYRQLWDTWDLAGLNL